MVEDLGKLMVEDPNQRRRENNSQVSREPQRPAEWHLKSWMRKQESYLNLGLLEESTVVDSWLSQRGIYFHEHDKLEPLLCSVCVCE